MFLKNKDKTPKTMNKTYDALSELAMMAGFLLFTFGVYLVWPPAACMVGGAGLFMLGFPSAKLFKRRQK